jgi:hypothetical protein
MRHATNLMLDEQSQMEMRRLPRTVSLSAIVRQLLICGGLNDRAFKAHLKKSAEAREVRLWLREKILGKMVE